VYSPGLGDVPRCRGCVASIPPAFVHLVTWCCHGVLVVSGHAVVVWVLVMVVLRQQWRDGEGRRG
jgi:hypothetical protein